MIKISSFEELLKKSSYMQTPRSLKYYNADAQTFYLLLKHFWEQNPLSSNLETKDYFQNLFEQEATDLFNLPSTKSETIKYHTMQYYLTHTSELEKAYHSLIEEVDDLENFYLDFSKEPYSNDKQTSIKRILAEIIIYIRNKAHPENLKTAKQFLNSSKANQEYYKKNTSSSNRNLLKLCVTYLKQGEFAVILEQLKQNEITLNKQIRDSYINSILQMKDKFERFFLFDKYTADYNRLVKSLDFFKLTTSVDEVKSLFSEEVLSSLDNVQLSMLNTFLINRYAKELESLNKTFFIVHSLDLWQDIRQSNPDNSGEINIKIKPSELEHMYRKMNFLYLANLEIRNKAMKQQESKQTPNGNLVVEVNFSDNVEPSNKSFGEKYFNYFNKLAPELNHNFVNDLLVFHTLQDTIANTYLFKDLNMVSILSTLYHYPNSLGNWGIISPKKNSKKVLLGFDMYGFNMPIRLHIDKSTILNFLKENRNSTLIPIYTGNEDFSPFGTMLGAPILIKPSLEYKQALQDYYNSENVGPSRKRLLAHLIYLCDFDKFPEHLKVEKVIKKKGKPPKIKKTLPPTKYFDLKNGKLYKLEGKDIVEIDTSIRIK